jgi:hypothetical protein
VAAPVVMLANKLVPNLQTTITNWTSKLTNMIPGATQAQGQAGFVSINGGPVIPIRQLQAAQQAQDMAGFVSVRQGSPLYRSR